MQELVVHGALDALASADATAEATAAAALDWLARVLASDELAAGSAALVPPELAHPARVKMAADAIKADASLMGSPPLRGTGAALSRWEDAAKEAAVHKSANLTQPCDHCVL
jgi:hypothetical protein